MASADHRNSGLSAPQSQASGLCGGNAITSGNSISVIDTQAGGFETALEFAFFRDHVSPIKPE